MKTSFIATLCLAFLIGSCGTKNAPAEGNQSEKENNMEEQLTLTQEWDKVFPQSDKVNHTKITFHNRNGTYALAGGIPDALPADAPQFMKDYHAFYKTPRGYHKRSLGSNGGWNVTSSLSLINQPILAYAPEIRSAVLLVLYDNLEKIPFDRIEGFFRTYLK